MRNLTSAAVHVLGFAILAVIAFASTAFLIAMLLAWGQGSADNYGANLYVGIVCNLIILLFVAVFHLRKEVITLSVPDHAAFLAQVKKCLSELGYDPNPNAADGLTFQPRFSSFLPGGRIHVKPNGADASIAGPRICLDLLRKRLRIRNHLENVHQRTQEGRRRYGDRFLKRVQVTVHTGPEQWQELLQHVLQPLGRDATITCKVVITAESDAGIPTQTVDTQVRPWLQLRDAQAEITRTPHPGFGSPSSRSPADTSQLGDTELVTPLPGA